MGRPEPVGQPLPRLVRFKCWFAAPEIASRNLFTTLLGRLREPEGWWGEGML